MTTPAKTAATKSTSAAKLSPTDNKSVANEKVETPVTETSTNETSVKEETPKERIPETLSNHAILADFCKQYLAVFDEIAAYNKEVLAERDAEWTSAKVLEKARELGSPTDANVKPDEEIKKYLTEWENAVNAMNVARRAVLDNTAKKLGINLSATAERDSAVEAPLKEKRKYAIEIGTQLSMIAKMTTDEGASSAVTDFLASNPLPAIGRDQARTFGNDGKATPKYRVTVIVKNKDGEQLFEEAGFTKASLALPKYYERGKALKSEDLRKAWESAGNSPDKTVTNPVEFVDNDLHYTLIKK